MRTREIIVISLFIITVCVVSIIPFSDNKPEGFTIPNIQQQIPQLPTTSQGTTPQATTMPHATTTPQATTMPQATTAIPTTTMPQATTAIPTTTTPQATTTMPQATTAIPTTTTPQATTTPSATTKQITTLTKITNNQEYLDTVIASLSTEPNPTNDKITIYKIQGMISSIKSQNAATLLGEIGNPNNLTDPRLFLQYMNWFGSNCPIDSDVCTGLSC